MATTKLLDYAIGITTRRPFIRRTWVDTNKTKRGLRIKTIDTPFFYKPLDPNLMINNQPIAGVYANGTHFVIKQDARTVGNVSTTTISAAGALFTSADAHTWTSRTLAVGAVLTSIALFDNKIWVFSKSTTNKSTDTTAGTSWTTTTSSPDTTGLYKPTVFGNKLVLCPFGQSTNLYGMDTAGNFTTYTLPTTVGVTGMATDGTTFIVVGHNNVATGFAFKSTDLVNWTPVVVKITASDVDMNQLALGPNHTSFLPVGITYNGTVFVIAAQDVQSAGGGIGAMSAGSFKFYTGTGTGTFLLKGEARIDKNNVSVSDKLQFVGLNSYLFRSSHIMACDSTGRIAMLATVTASTYVDATQYFNTTAVLVYSDDDGSTWDVSDAGGKESSGPYANNPTFIPSGLYTAPFGFMGYLCSASTSTVDYYVRTNPDARELAMPY